MKRNAFLMLLISLCLPTVNLFSWHSERNFQRLSTHTLITEYGYKILGSDILPLSSQMDIGSLQRTLDEMKRSENWKKVLHGSVVPDSKPNFALFPDHFWDPENEENYTATNLTNIDPQMGPIHTDVGDLFKSFLAYIAHTAETRVREYFAEAVYLWRVDDHETALYYLGMASHYLQDICCPVHSTNTIAVLDYNGQHIEFEKFVERIKENYIIKSIEDRVDSPERDPLNSSWYQKVIGAEYIADFLRELCFVCGTTSKDIIAHCYANKIPFREPVFNSVAIPAMATAQKAESILIFAFVYMVNSGDVPSTETTLFTATISTRDEDGYWGIDSYGTNNAIFWGIEFKDGRTFEQYCGKKPQKIGGRVSCSMEVRGEKGENVRKVWVRKARIRPFANGWLPMAEDNWYPRSIELTSSDHGINFLAEPNDWIIGNAGIVFDAENHTQAPFRNRRTHSFYYNSTKD